MSLLDCLKIMLSEETDGNKTLEELENSGNQKIVEELKRSRENLGKIIDNYGKESKKLVVQANSKVQSERDRLRNTEKSIKNKDNSREEDKKGLEL